MIGFTNKQSMSFVMLIIRDSSDKPSHFLRHYPSGEERWLFFIIYPFLLGLVLSQAIFFTKKSFKSREIGSFFSHKNPVQIEKNKNAYDCLEYKSSTILQTLTSNG